MASSALGRDLGFVQGKPWSDGPEDPAWGRAVSSSFSVNIPAGQGSTASIGSFLFFSPFCCKLKQETSHKTYVWRLMGYDKVNILVTSTRAMAPEALPRALSHSPPPKPAAIIGFLCVLFRFLTQGCILNAVVWSCPFLNIPVLSSFNLCSFLFLTTVY